MKEEEKIEELNDEMSRSQDELNDELEVRNDENDANDANDANEEPEVDETEVLKERIAELEDKNLRMMAEFDNYRRRTNKEKLELMATAGERIFKEMLPLVDDFERAIEAISHQPSDVSQLGEGVNLIYQKFLAFLEKNDVHPIETEGVDFNTDEHEAVTTFAAGEDQKGKVIDCTQKGYKLGEKVIRFAKVVVGE